MDCGEAEKQRAVLRKTDFPWDRYIEKIEAQAGTILAGSTEVRIIGYSFAPIDSMHVADKLLNQISKGTKIIVQNMDLATVRPRVEAYPTLRGRVEFDSTPF